MSPQPRKRRRAPVVGLLVILGAAVAGASLAPRPARAQAISPALRAEAIRLARDLAQIRGVAPGPPPRLAIRTRDERRRFIEGEIARKLPPARIEAERRALVAWGLVSPDFDLGTFLADLLVEQAAAYYDPVAKTMVLANWLPPDQQREVLAHELVHALQDRQMDLERFVTPAPGRSDEALARQAVVEGEAVALTLQLTLRRQGRDLADLPDVNDLSRAIESSATGPTLLRAPRYVRAVLTFPYARGLAFVHALRRRAAWTAMATLYRDPPRSSSQILHPDRYFDRREDPLPIVLPDLAAVLGPGARRVIEDDVGEFTLGQVMAAFLGDRTVLPHWRGDRYALWETASGQACLVARFAWRDDAAAGAFAAAYDRLLETKHGLPAGAGTRVAAGEAFVVERRGAEVLVLERAPLALVEPLRRVLWGETGAQLQRTPARLSRTTPTSITAAPSAISRTR